MMFILHNLPPGTRFQDVKNLIKEKCGITEIILDNLLSEGSRKRITVGLADEDDAALLVKEIDGLFICGHPVSVEDLGKKKKQARVSLNVWENNHNPKDHKDVGLIETEKWNGHVGNVWEVNSVPDQDRTFRSNTPEPRDIERGYRVDTNSRDYDVLYRDRDFDRDYGNWKHEHNIYSIEHDNGVSYKNNDYSKAYLPSRDDYSYDQFQDSPRNTKGDFNIKHHDTPRPDRTWDEERTHRETFRHNDQQYTDNYSKSYNWTVNEYDRRDGSSRRGFHEFSRSQRHKEQFTEDYKKPSYREPPSYIRPKSFPQPETSYASHKPQSYMNIFDESVQGKINAAVSKLAQDLSKNIRTDLNMNLIVRELKKNIRERVYDIFTGKEISKNEIIVLLLLLLRLWR